MEVVTSCGWFIASQLAHGAVGGHEAEYDAREANVECSVEGSSGTHIDDWMSIMISNLCIRNVVAKRSTH